MDIVRKQSREAFTPSATSAGGGVGRGGLTHLADVVVDPCRGRVDGATHRLDAFGIGIVALFRAAKRGVPLGLGVQRRGEIRVRAAEHHARRRGGREPRKRAGRRVGVESRRVRQRTRKTTRQTVAGVKRAGERRAVIGGRRIDPVDATARSEASTGRGVPVKPDPEVGVERLRDGDVVGIVRAETDGGDDDRGSADVRADGFGGDPSLADAVGDGHGGLEARGAAALAPGRGIVEDEGERRARAADVDEGVGAPRAVAVGDGDVRGGWGVAARGHALDGGLGDEDRGDDVDGVLGGEAHGEGRAAAEPGAGDGDARAAGDVRLVGSK